MNDVPVRRRVTITEEISHEGTRGIADPIVKSATIAVVKNPYAGIWEEDLSRLTEWGVTLGRELATAAVEQIGGASDAEGYGKGGVVGTDGEREHVAAILHPKLGAPVREAVGGGEAIIPSTVKMGAPGTTLDVPTHFKDDEWLGSHWDATEIRVPDAPCADELLVAVVVTTGGRPHARIGGRVVDETEE